MKPVHFVCICIVFVSTLALAQSNPVPFVNEPPVPTATAPGGPSFTLTVNGTGFVSGSAIHWNGTPLSTTFVNSSQLTATVPASNIATASTASITVLNASPGGGTSNVVFFAVSAPTTLQFTSIPSNSGVGPYSQPIAADFNGDGKLDFVVINFFPIHDYTFFTFLGNGDGSFQSPKSSPAMQTAAIGDFNGDGKLDVAGTDCAYNSCSFSVSLGNGDGTFSPFGNQYSLPPLTSYQVLTGDFNRDGKLDVAIIDLNGGIYVYLGNGDGTFQNPLISNVGSFSTVGGVGDFNGDGKLDLIGVNGTQLAWLQGNGDGTFRSPSTYYTLGSNNGNLIAADLNGDSKLDLITIQSNTFTVLLGNGDGTFQHPGSVYPVGSNLQVGIIGDFNADGKLDLVLSDYLNQLKTFLVPGNGDGTFQSPLALPTGSRQCVAGDFNNDGKLDLVLALNNDVAYLLQEAPLPGFSPSSVAFTSEALGMTSSPQNVMLTNNGTGPLTISSITILGANSGDFSQTNNCPASLAVGANCQIGITFTPTALGARNASLTVADNGPGNPQGTPLSGTGVQPVVQFDRPNVGFSPQTVGNTDPGQIVTLSNFGGSILTISSIGITGVNASDFADTSACATTLGVGASCQISVTFIPTASGTRNAALTISDNAPGSPQSVALSGTGQDFSLTPSGPPTTTVSPGQTATYLIAVTPGGGFNQTVNLSCSGAPAHSTCTVSSSVTLDGINASTATVAVITTSHAMGLTQPVRVAPIGSAFSDCITLSGILGLVVLATLSGRRRAQNPQLVCGMTLIGLLSIWITLSACGGGQSNGGSGGTQAGTYSLTLTGTSAAAKLTHKTNLTLVVQ